MPRLSFSNLAHEAVEAAEAAEAAVGTAVEKVEAEAEELVQEAEAEVCEGVQEAEAEVVYLGQEAQHAFENIQKSLTKKVEKGPVAPAHCIVDSTWFNAIVMTMTMLNTIQMGMEADHPDWTSVWLICENIFTAGFFMEMVIKLFTYRWGYFRDPPNLLDGFLTSLGVFDCWIMALIGNGGGVDLQSLSVLRVLRLLRLARIIKLMRSVKPLLLVIQGVMKAMSTAVYVFALCIFIFYVFAIFLTEHLGRAENDKYPGFSTIENVIDEQEFMQNYNPHICFGSMISSMLTLFNMAVLAEWAEIIRPIAYKQPQYLPLFMFFATCVGFGVMNVLIAVIVDVVTAESRKIESEYQTQIKKKKLKTLGRIQALLKRIDTNSDGVIELSELSSAMEESKQLQELMAAIDLPQGWTAEELLDMLDNNSDGVLQYGEFATSFFRLMDSDDFQQICIMQASINQVKHLIKDNTDQFVERQSVMQADLAAIKTALGIADGCTRPKLEEHTVEFATNLPTHAMTRSCSEPCGNLKELHTDAAQYQCVDRVEMMSKELAGSTSDVSHKSPAESDQVQHTVEFATNLPKRAMTRPCSEPCGNLKELHSDAAQPLKEVLDAALIAVEECIRKEFASFKPNFESELGCLRTEQNGFRRRQCESLVEADVETLSACLAAPSSGATELTAGNLSASYNLTDGNREGELANDNESSVQESRFREFTPGNDKLPEPSASNSAVAASCLRHSEVLASELQSSAKPRLSSNSDEGCGHDVAAQPEGCSWHDARSRHDDDANDDGQFEGRAQEDSLLAAIRPVRLQSVMQDFLFDDDTQRLGFEVYWVKDGLPLVGTVAPGGAASIQGVLEGDKLAECNGVCTAGKDRQEVLQMLATRPLQLRMLRP